MMSDEKKAASRRDFLKLASAAAPAAAVTVVAGGKADAAVDEPSEGFRTTEHIEKYLASARF